jgi:hypothetical protein
MRYSASLVVLFVRSSILRLSGSGRSSWTATSSKRTEAPVRPRSMVLMSRSWMLSVI